MENLTVIFEEDESTITLNTEQITSIYCDSIISSMIIRDIKVLKYHSRSPFIDIYNKITFREKWINMNVDICSLCDSILNSADINAYKRNVLFDMWKDLVLLSFSQQYNNEITHKLLEVAKKKSFNINIIFLSAYLNIDTIVYMHPYFNICTTMAKCILGLFSASYVLLYNRNDKEQLEAAEKVIRHISNCFSAMESLAGKQIVIIMVKLEKYLPLVGNARLEVNKLMVKMKEDEELSKNFGNMKLL